MSYYDPQTKTMNTERPTKTIITTDSNLISTVMLFAILVIGAYLGINYLAPIVAASLKPAVTPVKVKVTL